MKISHREKLRIARRGMTQDEIKAKIPAFTSMAWVASKNK